MPLTVDPHVLGEAARCSVIFQTPLRVSSMRRRMALAWHGLRSYLNKPVFWARVPKDNHARSSKLVFIFERLS